MKTKKLIAILIVLALLVSLLPMTVAAEEEPKTGSCGENATWEVNPSAKILWIRGTGSMSFDSYYFEAPWSPWEAYIQRIIIEEGITEAKGFSTCKWVDYVKIPASLESFSYEEFSNAPYLSCIDVDEGNQVYSQRDGVLFTKDQKTLLRFPAHYRGLYTVPETVTTIAEKAFSGSRSLVEVILPEGLTVIEKEAFTDCSSLAHVKLPQSLRKIRSKAFYGCIGLENICFPDALSTIETGAFWYTGLRSVEIPDSVVNYGGAFGYCSKLESITAGKGVLSNLEDDYWCTPSLKTVKVSNQNANYFCDEKGVLYLKNGEELLAAPDAMQGEYCVRPGTEFIGYSAFSGCYGIKKVELPDSVYCIGEQAFANCVSLEEINLEGITWYGMAALTGCHALRSITLAPEQPYFAPYVFSGSGLTEVEIPEGYTSVGEGMFHFCSNLETVHLPDTLETIGGDAFACSGLKSIHIPASLKSLGWGALYGCYDMEEFVVSPGNEAFKTDTAGVIYSGDQTELYYVPASAGDLIILPETVELISDSAFAAGTVRTVVIPEGIIEYDILRSLSGACIEKFIVAETNPAFSADEQGALYNKDQTVLLQLPGGFQGAYFAPEQLNHIEDAAFTGCTGLTEVHVGKNVTDVDYQFFYMPNVPAFYVSEDHPNYYNDEKGVLYSKDGTRLIYAPKNLEGEYSIPDTVTMIHVGAFQNCNKLRAIDMSTCSLACIPEYAFEGCTALQEIHFPENGLKTVEAFAFYGCSALQEIDLSQGGFVLKEDAFGNCTALKSVVLPYSLKEMDRAFGNCKSLEKVRFLGHLPLCGRETFLCYDEETGHEYMPPKMIVEYRYYGYFIQGFVAPYWMGIPIRLPSEDTSPCTGEDCPCAKFTDMPPVDHWAHNAIDTLVYPGYFRGVDDDRFNPNGTMTRAMFVTILHRYYGEQEAEACPFTDVPADTWYTDAVAWAVERGIINGVGNNCFAPNQPVTREQVATILTRLSYEENLETGRNLGWLGYFSDADAVSDYAHVPMAFMVGLGVINGKGDRLDPQGSATRAEVATMLWRWSEFYPNINV